MRKKIGKICLLIYSFMFSCINSVHALSNDDLYKGMSGDKIILVARYIGGWIRYGAIAIAVGMLMYKGIQFILVSPDGKAEIKKQMTPWAIGLLILFTFNIVLSFVAGWGENFNFSYSDPSNV